MKMSRWVFATAGLLLLAGAGFVAQGCGGSNKHADGSEGGGELDGTVGAGGLLAQGGALGGGGISGGGGGSAPASCGGPGMPCCVGNGCAGGGCCVSGICMAPGGQCVGLGDGICNAGACGACGASGMACCGANPSAGSCTASKTKCNAGTCTACGTLGSVCCTDATGGNGTCDGEGVICSNGLCVACGMPGTSCCPGSTCSGNGCCFGNVCLAEGTACGASWGACAAGRCSGCGGSGQPCCSNECYDGLVCNGGSCASCGNGGEACCPGTNPAARCKPGNACIASGADGVCARCGGLGDVCCADSPCSDGCCSAGRCIAGAACTTPDAAIAPDAPPAGTGGAGTGGNVGTGGVVGTGGKGTGGIVGTGGVSGTGGTTAPGPCGDVIDDMEAGTGWICNGNGRVGFWFTYVDSYTTSSSITPAPGDVAKPALMSTARDTSQYAMHASGKFTDYAGIGLLLNLAVQGETPSIYDASGYTGIKFWAKGSPSYMEVRVQMPSTSTVANGGTCTLTSCMPNLELLSTLSTSWKQFTVPFSYLTGGSATLKPSTLWSIEFGPYNYYGDANLSFDIWIDDVTFYK